RQVRGRYPDPRVPDPEENVAILRPRAHRDAPTRTGELGGVADQVLDDLKESMPVSPDVGEIRRHLEVEIEKDGGHERLLGLHTIGDNLACGDPLSFHGETACFHAGDVEEIPDQSIHPEARALDRLRGRLRWALRLAFAPLEQ